VELGTPWDFDIPVATGVNITLSHSTVTNMLCGLSFVATRTWEARDASDFTATCSQSVTVKDSRPPIVLCGTNKSVELGTIWEFDQPSGQAAANVEALVYDNNSEGILAPYEVGLREVGNQVSLGGANRFPKSFSIEYWGAASPGPNFQGIVQARVRFYRNDGPVVDSLPGPGTVFYDSGLLPIS
jgi:hypothetical protein